MTPATSWRRLPAITLFYFVVKSIPQLLNLWPALLGIWAAGATVRGLLLDHGLVIIVALAILGVLLPYWFFRYQIASDHIQLRSGVLRRKRLTLYFDRVQQADISQPFYFRPFGLAILGLESAGSGQQEVELPGLPLTEAEALKNRILAYRQQVVQSSETSHPDKPGEDARPADYELHLPWHEVARYGLMHNGLIFLLPLLAPVLESQLPAMEQWLESLSASQLHQTVLAATGGNMVPVFVVFSVLSALAGLVAVYVTSAAIALVRWWDYHLTRVEDQYQYRAGLLTIKTRGFRLHKLQLVTFSQGLVARWLKRCTVTISKAGGTAPQTQDEQRFLIPVVSPTTLDALKRQLALPRPQWSRIHPLYICWRGLLTGSVFSLLTALLLLGNEWNPWPALLIYPLFGLIAWRSWWCLGFHQDDQWLALKSGFIGRKIRWLPIVKAQKITVSQPPWLRLFGLCNLSIWSADGLLTLPCVREKTALALRDKTLYFVSTFSGKWM